MAKPAKAPAKRRAPTAASILASMRARIRLQLGRINAVSTNGRHLMASVMHDRFIGAEHALLDAAGHDNYLDLWLTKAEAEIRAAHASTPKNPCGCGVCRREP